MWQLAQLKAGDVLVVTCAKAGTNLMLQMVTQIASRGEMNYPHIHDVVPWPDVESFYPNCKSINSYAVPLSEKRSDELRAVKTHLILGKDIRIDQVPDGVKVIYVCRDPKSVVFSQREFFESTAFGYLMPSLDVYIDLFLREECLMDGLWADHVANAWNAQSDRVQFLFYEQVTANLAATVDDVCKFLQVKLKFYN
jgi:hypothetical protein